MVKEDHTVVYSTVQYSTVQYSTVQYKSVQLTTLRYITFRYNYSTIHANYCAIHYSKLQYDTLHHKPLKRCALADLCACGAVSAVGTSRDFQGRQRNWAATRGEGRGTRQVFSLVFLQQFYH